MRTKLFVLTLLAALFSVSVATAQFYNKKKVVITEVVDKAGEVADVAKVFIRSALTDAAAPAPKRAAAAFFANAPASSPAPAPAVRTYKVGDYIEINGVGGVVFAVWNNGQNGKAVSLKEFECDWYSAPQKCSSLGKGWRLPSMSEWRAIYNQKSVINNTLASMAEKGLSNALYWSSVEYNSDCAWLFLVGYGNTRKSGKIHDYSVRAVSDF